MTYQLTVTLGFSPSAIMEDPSHEEKEILSLVEVVEEEELSGGLENYIGTRVRLSSKSADNILEFLRRTEEFSKEEIVSLMSEVEIV